MKFYKHHSTGTVVTVLHEAELLNCHSDTDEVVVFQTHGKPGTIAMAKKVFSQEYREVEPDPDMALAMVERDNPLFKPLKVAVTLLGDTIDVVAAVVERYKMEHQIGDDHPMAKMLGQTDEFFQSLDQAGLMTHALVKVQRPLWTSDPEKDEYLVYDKRRDIEVQGPVPDDVKEWFADGKAKVYAVARLWGDGEMQLIAPTGEEYDW